MATTITSLLPPRIRLLAPRYSLKISSLKKPTAFAAGFFNASFIEKLFRKSPLRHAALSMLYSFVVRDFLHSFRVIMWLTHMRPGSHSRHRGRATLRQEVAQPLAGRVAIERTHALGHGGGLGLASGLAVDDAAAHDQRLAGVVDLRHGAQLIAEAHGM